MEELWTKIWFYQKELIIGTLRNDDDDDDGNEDVISKDNFSFL